MRPVKVVGISAVGARRLPLNAGQQVFLDVALGV